MKSVQKLDVFGTGYIEVEKMTEEKIECGEGRKGSSACDCIPEGCFGFTQLTTSQVSGLAYVANQEEQLWHE